MARDPDRLARFSREAQLLASLNHPHIAQIHGLEDAGGVRALVMELVEGPTLADRIAGAAIPIDEALSIARQIALALEAAHEQGIIHRDLKPANIKVREDGTVKVLDFGLATDAAESGVIAGTAAYMSPEQARGQAAGKRADLWAFGCVLYEMLTQSRVFDGDRPTDVIAAVVADDPDWTKLPAGTPVPIRTLLRQCLEKDQVRRLDSVTAARSVIDGAMAAPAVEALVRAAAASRRVARVATATVAALVLIAGIVAWILTRPAPQPLPVSSRFAIVTPSSQPLNVSSLDRDLALSPDGRLLVYRAGGSTTAGGPLMVRAIGQLDARPLADISNADAPFFSPDGRWIGFFEKAELKKISIAGGPATALSPFTGAPLGASWGDDNAIVFATSDPDTGLWRVPADGGSPTVLTKPDAAQREGDHGFPSVLPGGRSVLLTIAAAGQTDTSQVVAIDLKTGQRKTLVRDGSQAEYVDPSGSGRDGYLIYASAGALRAVRFDPVRLEVFGDPVTVVEHVMMKPNGAANYAVSPSGTLAYMPGEAGELEPMRSLVWVDRKGHEEPSGLPLRSYGPPRLSPDGTRVAVGILDHGNTEIFIWDFARKTLRQLTVSPGTDGLPHWTRDGRRIVFMSARAGVPNLYAQSADGTGTVDRLTTSTSSQWPTAMTPDGTAVVGFELRPGEVGAGVIRLPLGGPKSRPGDGVSPSPVEPFVESLFNGAHPDISPDGRYIAYESRGPGPLEVFVRPFPQVNGGRWQISTAGGSRAAWARNGRELFYVDTSMTLMAVPVRTSGTTFSMGRPVKVFDTRYAQPNPARHYDISADGQRFLMVKDHAAGDADRTPASMVVVEHWFAELKARVR